jgi:hypothetical protein
VRDLATLNPFQAGGPLAYLKSVANVLEKDAPPGSEALIHALNTPVLNLGSSINKDFAKLKTWAQEHRKTIQIVAAVVGIVFIAIYAAPYLATASKSATLAASSSTGAGVAAGGTSVAAAGAGTASLTTGGLSAAIGKGAMAYGTALLKQAATGAIKKEIAQQGIQPVYDNLKQRQSAGVSGSEEMQAIALLEANLNQLKAMQSSGTMGASIFQSMKPLLEEDARLKAVSEGRIPASSAGRIPASSAVTLENLTAEKISELGGCSLEDAQIGLIAMNKNAADAGLSLEEYLRGGNFIPTDGYTPQPIIEKPGIVLAPSNTTYAVRDYKQQTPDTNPVSVAQNALDNAKAAKATEDALRAEAASVQQSLQGGTGGMLAIGKLATLEAQIQAANANTVEAINRAAAIQQSIASASPGQYPVQSRAEVAQQVLSPMPSWLLPVGIGVGVLLIVGLTRR